MPDKKNPTLVAPAPEPVRPKPKVTDIPAAIAAAESIEELVALVSDLPPEKKNPLGHLLAVRMNEIMKVQ